MNSAELAEELRREYFQNYDTPELISRENSFALQEFCKDAPTDGDEDSGEDWGTVTAANYARFMRASSVFVIDCESMTKAALKALGLKHDEEEAVEPEISLRAFVLSERTEFSPWRGNSSAVCYGIQTSGELGAGEISLHSAQRISDAHVLTAGAHFRSYGATPLVCAYLQSAAKLDARTEASIRVEVEPGSNRIVDRDTVDCANGLAIAMDTTRQFARDTAAKFSVRLAQPSQHLSTSDWKDFVAVEDGFVLGHADVCMSLSHVLVRDHNVSEEADQKPEGLVHIDSKGNWHTQSQHGGTHAESENNITQKFPGSKATVSGTTGRLCVGADLHTTLLTTTGECWMQMKPTSRTRAALCLSLDVGRDGISNLILNVGEDKEALIHGLHRCKPSLRFTSAWCTSKYVVWSLSSSCSNRGLVLTAMVKKGRHVLKVPVLLSFERSWLQFLCASLLPLTMLVVGRWRTCSARKDWMRWRARRRLEKRRSRVDADAERIRAKEEAVNGLVIEKAIFGANLDVTAACQRLVQESTLSIPACKFTLPGFDVAPMPPTNSTEDRLTALSSWGRLHWLLMRVLSVWRLDEQPDNSLWVSSPDPPKREANSSADQLSWWQRTRRWFSVLIGRETPQEQQLGVSGRQLVIRYRLHGETKTVQCGEGETLRIP